MPEKLVFRREKISQQLYNDLLNGILVGDYPPLSSLPTETRLASEYGISRTTVRAALAQLKNEGFVVSRQGSGTIVADKERVDLSPFTPVASLVDLEKCFECRILLEPEIAGLAAEHRTDEDVIFLEKHIHSIEQPTENIAKYAAEDARFHLRLAGMSGNKFFGSIMASLQPHIVFGMNIAKTLPANVRRNNLIPAMQEHQQLVSAIIDRDAELARQSMFFHIRNSHRRLFEGN